jgi:hypothetical protein
MYTAKRTSEMDHSITRSIEQLFPDSQIRGCKMRPYKNSRIFILDLLQGDERHMIVVKSSNSYSPQQVAREYNNLSLFNRDCTDPLVSSPKPLFADPDRGFFIMSYIDGINLSYMLHELRPTSRDYLENAVELCALALARFHSIFQKKDDAPLFIDGASKEEDINRCMAENAGKISNCRLSLKVTPFFDFSSWNIMMDKEDSKLYLIDFPKTDYVFTPHLDLGRFKFGLELIKQYPPAKFIGLNRWDVDAIYGRFLDRYCREMRVTPNGDDLRLINCFLKANIRRSQDLHRKGKCGWQSRLEKLYLQTFCRDWLDK